jgi:hypothetical protein
MREQAINLKILFEIFGIFAGYEFVLVISCIFFMGEGLVLLKRVALLFEFLFLFAS